MAGAGGRPPRRSPLPADARLPDAGRRVRRGALPELWLGPDAGGDEVDARLHGLPGACRAGTAGAAEGPTRPTRPEHQPKPPAPEPPAAKRRPPTQPRQPSPGKIGRIGDKLVRELWSGVATDDDRLALLCADGSPAAAAVRLFGARGLGYAIGLPVGDVPSSAEFHMFPGEPKRHTTAPARSTPLAGGGFRSRCAGRRPGRAGRSRRSCHTPDRFPVGSCSRVRAARR